MANGFKATSQQMLSPPNKERSIGDFLENKRTEYHELFVDDSVLSDLTCFFSEFPTGLSSFWGFEFDLNTHSHHVDFLLCIHQPDELHAWIQNAKKQRIVKDEIAKGLSDFSIKWRKDYNYIFNNIWFEYDYSEIQKNNYIPNLFLGPKKNVHILNLLDTIHNVFQGLEFKVQKPSYKLLLSCISKLPKGSWVSQVGVMHARRDNNLRVFIQDIPKGAVLPYLEDVEYPDVRNTHVKDWLQIAYRHCRKVELDLDLGVTIGNHIGLELYFEFMDEALSFLKHLYERGLCTRQKYLSFTEHLQTLNINKEAGMHQFLSHFKISFDGVSNFKSKAYIGYITADQAKNATATKPINHKTTKQ